MIISCPACATRYNIDPAVLGDDGRRVRCANCGHNWIQAAPAVDIDDVDMPDSLSEPLEVEDAPDHSDDFDLEAEAEAGLGNLDSLADDGAGVRGGFPTAWAIAVVLIISLLVATYFGTPKIAPLVGEPVGPFLTQTRAFIDEKISALTTESADQSDDGETAGAAPQDTNVVSTSTLEITTNLDVVPELRNGTEVQIIKISGEVINKSDEARALSPISAYLLDGNGSVPTSWPVRPASDFLEPRSSTTYSTQLENPDPTGVEVEIKFDSGS